MYKAKNLFFLFGGGMFFNFIFFFGSDLFLLLLFIYSSCLFLFFFFFFGQFSFLQKLFLYKCPWIQCAKNWIEYWISIEYVLCLEQLLHKQGEELANSSFLSVNQKYQGDNILGITYIHHDSGLKPRAMLLLTYRLLKN